MEVADVQNGEASKRRRQFGKPQVVSSNDDAFGISACAPIDPSALEQFE
jgi:hypothetical protein